jgi:hypothetical protein
MKTFTNTTKIAMFSLLILLTGPAQTSFAQSSTELVFKNASLQSGTALQDGATYVFPLVSSGVDAIVTIVGRSEASVVINNIDVTNTGFNKAFQPQLGKSGSVAPNSDWWVDFNITFYQAGNYTTAGKVQMDNIIASGLDIDGDNSTVREYSQMNEITSYTAAASSALQASLITALPVNSVSGKPEYNYQFLGPTQNFSDIDTNAVSVMASYVYSFKKSIKFRIGGVTGSSSANSPMRLNSIWFKKFSLSTLPVKMESFSATLNDISNRVELKWVTASEKNVSHFVIEKSTDGKNFFDAGIMFAYGSAIESTSYSFSDNLKNANSGIIYYRLRTVDVDAKGQYSETRIIRLGQQAEKEIKILTYPNPVTNELRITIPATWQNKQVVYEVIGVNGQPAKKSVNGNSSQTETLNVSSLSPGFYIVRVSFNGQTAQQKIVKQ